MGAMVAMSETLTKLSQIPRTLVIACKILMILVGVVAVVCILVFADEFSSEEMTLHCEVTSVNGEALSNPVSYNFRYDPSWNGYILSWYTGVAHNDFSDSSFYNLLMEPRRGACTRMHSCRLKNVRIDKTSGALEMTEFGNVEAGYVEDVPGEPTPNYPVRRNIGKCRL
jgi:hypothetical protein